MARIRAVFFDVDGTLLDSNDAQAHAWLDVLRGHGRSVPYDVVRSKLGMGTGALLRDLAGIDPASTLGKAVLEHRTAILRAHYLEDVGPFTGARVLVDRLRSRGLLCGVVTTTSSVETLDLLRQAAVADLMDAVVTADDAPATATLADLLELGVGRVNVPAAEATFIGDTPDDLESALQVGLAPIAFRCGGFSDEALEAALAIYDGPSQLSSRLDQSPLARGVEDEAELGERRRGGRRSAATSSR